MAAHLAPGTERGGKRSVNGSNTGNIVDLAASVKSDFARLTAQLVLERFRAGTLDIAILEALLLAAGLEA